MLQVTAIPLKLSILQSAEGLWQTGTWCGPKGQHLACTARVCHVCCLEMQGSSAVHCCAQGQIHVQGHFPWQGLNWQDCRLEATRQRHACTACCRKHPGTVCQQGCKGPRTGTHTKYDIIMTSDCYEITHLTYSLWTNSGQQDFGTL